MTSNGVAVKEPRSTPAASWRDADDLRWATRHWATRLNVRPPHVHIRPMRTKWASISTAGRLTLNAELLVLPKHLGEYVIVHELVHLLVPNHGPVMKHLLSAYLPDWAERERTLRTPAPRRRARALPTPKPAR